MTAVSISDQRTAETIREVHCNYGYILDPHGAVAYAALADHLEKHPGASGIILETAHPVKFDSVAEIISADVDVPTSISELYTKQKMVTEIGPDYDAVRELILEKAK